MGKKFSAAARAEIAATINDTDTVLTIVSGGHLFPVATVDNRDVSEGGDWFKLTLQDHEGFEIVYCRTHGEGSNTFTNLLRGQEGTEARQFNAGAVVGLRPTHVDADDWENKEPAITPGEASEFWAGDKSWKKLEITHVQGLNSSLNSKVDKVPGKQLSTENFTTSEKNKLATIQEGAQVNPIPVTNLESTDDSVPLAASQGKALKDLIDAINTILQSDDTTLDELQEIVDYIKLNRSDLENLSITNIAGLQNALSQKVDITDTRLTDPREWTAKEVTQEEAEEGISNLPRKWSVERVIQAVTAWWNRTAAKEKLDGIEEEATKNQTDAYLLDRANHTGTQDVSSITGLTKSVLGLGAVDNTSDMDKPISLAVGAALEGKAEKTHTHDVADVTGLQNLLDTKLESETYGDRGGLGTEDLNNVRTPGIFGQVVHAEAQLARNYPAEGVPGALEVIILDPSTTPYPVCVQRFTTNEAEQRVFIRRGGAAGGWNEWTEIGASSGREVTVSTASPSGGEDGDIWLMVG